MSESHCIVNWNKPLLKALAFGTPFIKFVSTQDTIGGQFCAVVNLDLMA